MGGQSRLEDIQFKLMVVEALRAIKSRYSYRALARILGVNHTLLARYVSGALLPSRGQAEKLWAGLRELVNIEEVVLRQLRERGFVDISSILSDPLYLRMLSLEFLDRFRGSSVSKILVPETSGITLATGMALTFNVPLVIARRRKANPHIEYLEAAVSEAPSTSRIFYIPKDSIRPGEAVLIVDDIVQTGLTLETMRILVERSGANLVGVAAVVVYGSEWRRRARLPPGARLEAVVGLEDLEAVRAGG